MDDATAVEAASLLLAVLALLNTVWSKSIQDCLNITFSPNQGARQQQKTEIRSLLNGRALPLAIGAWLIAAAFMPRLLSIVGNALECLGEISCNYDEISAVFLLAQTFIVALAFFLTIQVFKLRRKIRKSK